MLSQEAAYGLWVLKCAMPALSAVAAQQFITLVVQHAAKRRHNLT
jgi:hypothetical protein